MALNLYVQTIRTDSFHSAYFLFCLQDGSKDVKKTSVYEEIVMYLLTDPVSAHFFTNDRIVARWLDHR